MGRPARLDRPGALHHVVNRGQGHSPIFASDADVHRFLTLLRFLTLAGELRVLAYALLSTHFHLVVQSVMGRLAAALQRVEQLYAKWYNRTRGRDGHAFKARYFSRPIEDEIDLACVVGYVDWNPFEAGMAASPGAYPHGSARYYLGEPSPRWLSRDLVEALACRIAQVERFQPSAYLSLWRFARGSGGSEVVRRASESRVVGVAPLQVLIRAGPEATQHWLMENLQREEGRTQPCLVVGGSELLLQWKSKSHGLDREGARDNALPAVAGMLHTLSGWTMSEIGAQFLVSQPTIHRAVAAHRRRMQGDPAYRERIAQFVATTVRAVYGAFT